MSVTKEDEKQFKEGIKEWKNALAREKKLEKLYKKKWHPKPFKRKRGLKKGEWKGRING